ncbi:MAG TPA: hypothetical protein VLA67_05450 [Nitrospiraceae bacterium]|nr:hypothetical protein [Nitrospiraceae bacterium]
MTAKTWAMALLAAYVLVACTGCAVYLAGKGRPGTNLDALEVGTSEQEVERQLGTPTTIEPLGTGKRLSRYHVELARQPSYLRAAAHILLDLTTYGIWELPGTIYELKSGPAKGEVGVVYGPDDHVLEIQDYRAIQVHAVSADDPLTPNTHEAAIWNAVMK